MPNEFIDLSAKNVRIWFLLAFQAGAVNAGGFLACSRFVTHTTGFATHFGVELAGHHEGAAIGMLAVPFFFLLGAMITSHFVDARLARGLPARYGVPSLLIFLSLLAALVGGLLGKFGPFNGEMAFRDDFPLLVLLCLASGLQNALVTNSAGIVVRTTHLTGVTTDLAMGLVRYLGGARGKERQATLARAGIIGSFVLGSTASAYLCTHLHFAAFSLPVLTSFWLFLYFLRRSLIQEPRHA